MQRVTQTAVFQLFSNKLRVWEGACKHKDFNVLLNFKWDSCGINKEKLLTFFEFAHSKHAVAGRQIPDAQGLVITHSGTQWQVRVGGQPPHFPLHMALDIQNRTQILLKHTLWLMALGHTTAALCSQKLSFAVPNDHHHMVMWESKILGNN